MGDGFLGGTVGVVRLFGVPIRLHFTFVLLLLFLVSIGVGAHQSSVMTALYVLSLFGSVVWHELGHALVARRYGIHTIDVVMFPIGGVARLDRAPRGPEELWIALAGPCASFLLALLTGAPLVLQEGIPSFDHLAEPTGANLAHRVVAGNLLLAAFNLLPAFPMDGGRVLRTLLAMRIGEERATRIAANSGQVLAILIGLYGLLAANFMLVFIAMFVYLGAGQEVSAVESRSLANGAQVRAAMVTDFRTLQHGDTMREAGDLLLATSQQDFPVLHGGQVVGLLKRGALLRSMLHDGPNAYVAGAMDRNFQRVAPDVELSVALSAIGGSCALVMEEENLLGLLTPENLSEFLVMKQISQIQARKEAQ